MRKLCLIALLWIFLPLAAQAQFLGYAAQQTTTTGFTIPAGNPTPLTVVSLPNIGQAGHSVVYAWSAGTGACSFDLEISAEGSVWLPLVMGPFINLVTTNNPNSVYANGWYPFIRLVVNPDNNALCKRGITGIYVGYQTPIPIPDFSATVQNAAVADLVDIPHLFTSAYSFPVLKGMQCYNDNGATAYLQIVRGTGLGLLVEFQVGIPAGQTFVYSGPPITIFNTRWGADAVTVANGFTPVTTPLVCSFQVNPFAPLLPRL